MKVILHYPKDCAILKQKIAEVHRQAVIALLKPLPCSSAQKIEIIKAAVALRNKT